MKYPWVVVGAKCKCIDATWRSTGFYDDDKLPVEGGVYTVRDVFLPDGKTLCIRLVEIVNEPREFGDPPTIFECCFAAWHFRPMIDAPDQKQTNEQLVDA